MHAAWRSATFCATSTESDDSLRLSSVCKSICLRAGPPLGAGSTRPEPAPRAPDGGCRFKPLLGRALARGGGRLSPEALGAGPLRTGAQCTCWYYKTVFCSKDLNSTRVVQAEPSEIDTCYSRSTLSVSRMRMATPTLRVPTDCSVHADVLAQDGASSGLYNHRKSKGN
eukprot:4945052-Pleurochrysis_carterae.AAC.4